MSRARQFREAVGCLVDFNALSALEFALDEALVVQRRVLQALPSQVVAVGLFLLDDDGRVLAVNREGAARFGTTVLALVGQRIWDLMPPEVAGFRRNMVALASARGCRFHYLDNLTGRWLDVYIEPLPDGAVLIRSLDVTDAAEFRLNAGRVQFVALQCRARTIE